MSAIALSLLPPAPAPARAQELPDFPRVNLAPSYTVDPDWPKRPQGVNWAAVPGIFVDRQDQVWVYTRANPPVQVYDASGKFLRAWGDEQIRTAHHLKIDGQGNVWVADIGNHLVMKFSAEGKLLLELGTRGEKGDDERHLNMPTDMAIAPSGDVFVSDGYGNNRVVHFDKTGKFVKSWGRMGVRPGEFSLPHAIALDSLGRLYVADRNNVRVQVFDQSGKLLDVWQNILTPWGLWITAKDEIWVCGSSPMVWEMSDKGEPVGCPPKDQLIARFSPEGKVLELASFPKAQDGQEKPGELNWVHCLALDSRGNLYLGDIIGRRAQKFIRHAGAAEHQPAETSK
jgi:DNA-binding beta-propeller fold protein YncE